MLNADQQAGLSHDTTGYHRIYKRHMVQGTEYRSKCDMPPRMVPGMTATESWVKKPKTQIQEPEISECGSYRVIFSNLASNPLVRFQTST